MFELVKSIPLLVLFCSRTEPNRIWKVPHLAFEHLFLSGRYLAKKDGFNFIHHNPSILRELSRRAPRVVVTTGFNPTHLYAFLWAIFMGSHHVCMTDGCIESEAGLSWVHRWVRILVFRFSQAFIAASQGGADLYRSYGIPEEKIFRSFLCADNDLFFSRSGTDERSYDVCFSGQLQERKQPLFFAEICHGVQQKRGRCRALILGEGPLKAALIDRLESYGIDYDFPGFLDQEALPGAYASARLLLFPTLHDPWGVVVNEAMAAGTPVITSSHAGAARELVVDGVTGYICDLNLEDWVARVLQILEAPQVWRELSENAKDRVRPYCYANAAKGIEDACAYVLSK